MRTLLQHLRLFLLPLALLTTGAPASASDFLVAGPGETIPLVLAAEDALGVERAARDFQDDIERVTGRRPEMLRALPGTGTAVIIGTLGHSPLLDDLIARGKLDVRDLEGRWEAFLHEVVEAPAPGLDRALVIAGSDRRGTMFGLYTLSEEFGVSPWYWWADIPVKQSASVSVVPVRRVEAPVVQYRGIFLNDEAPALSGWAAEKFGDINSGMYVHVFELLLRLRANFLWPAMWNNAFHDDDAASGPLAHEYGIVMSTSHHEPMMRAHQEWYRYGEGPWNYDTNGEVLRRFWRDAIRERKDFESVITLAMRGDGDEAMEEGTNVALLERIVADQRAILTGEFDRPLEDVPQVWALYKEVQDYYEHGMRVPDDVILLWCDDNWGNIRRLPTPEERGRAGGAGVYYHFDYVGGPRSYKWINVTPLTKVWEQMHLAWKHEANRIWVVNVGDLKPMELPTDFFLAMAWDPAAMPYERALDYSREWSARNFGEAHASELGTLLDGYARLNRQRTPEMMDPGTYSLLNYREAERIAGEWAGLVRLAEDLRGRIDAKARDAYFQLYYYPVVASATVREIFIAAGRNHLYRLQGRTEARTQAERARALFDRDEALKKEFHSLGDGRWNHQMAQINLGYTYWQQPPIESLPALYDVRPAEGAEAGLAVEGSPIGWPRWGSPAPRLPTLDSFARPTRWLELFNRGETPFRFEATTSVPWLRLSAREGLVTESFRLEVEVDWDRAPHGSSTQEIVLTGGGQRFVVSVPVFHPSSPTPAELAGRYVESDGHLAMEAPRYNRARESQGIGWKALPGHGQALGGMMIEPVTAAPIEPGGDSPRLEYDFYSFSSGEAKVLFHFAPSLDIQSGEGLRFAYSLNDGPPRVLRVDTWKTLQTWEAAVGRDRQEVTATINLPVAGTHTLKVWAVTPGVVLHRVLIDFGGLRPSYLGPPESPRF
jgi:PAS domain-containing protein